MVIYLWVYSDHFNRYSNQNAEDQVTKPLMNLIFLNGHLSNYRQFSVRNKCPWRFKINEIKRLIMGYHSIFGVEVIAITSIFFVFVRKCSNYCLSLVNVSSCYILIPFKHRKSFHKHLCPMFYYTNYWIKFDMTV